MLLRILLSFHGMVVKVTINLESIVTTTVYVQLWRLLSQFYQYMVVTCKCSLSCSCYNWQSALSVLVNTGGSILMASFKRYVWIRNLPSIFVCVWQAQRTNTAQSISHLDFHCAFLPLMVAASVDSSCEEMEITSTNTDWWEFSALCLRGVYLIDQSN